MISYNELQQTAQLIHSPFKPTFFRLAVPVNRRSELQVGGVYVLAIQTCEAKIEKNCCKQRTLVILCTDSDITFYIFFYHVKYEHPPL